MLRTALAASALAALAGFCLPALADDTSHRDPAEMANEVQRRRKPVSDEVAKETLRRWEKDLRSRDENRRITAVRGLEGKIHPRVAERLLKLAAREKDPVVRRLAFEALAEQAPVSKRLKARVVALVNAEADEAMKNRSAGRHGYIIEPRTGDPIRGTPEAEAKLTEFETRLAATEAAIRCMIRLECRRGVSQKTIAEFLQSSYDPVVVAILDAVATWKDWAALRDIFGLFEYYPSEDRWDSAKAATYIGNEAITAGRWSSVFGDPGKRRNRPIVVRAIRKAVREITGKECKAPAELKKLMSDREVKRKMRVARKWR
ncbi:MAG: HEAT repeat domain-containing protein [Planctomycetota bacterium]|jgi:hypothetical protein